MLSDFVLKVVASSSSLNYCFQYFMLIPLSFIYGLYWCLTGYFKRISLGCTGMEFCLFVFDCMNVAVVMYVLWSTRLMLNVGIKMCRGMTCKG